MKEKKIRLLFVCLGNICRSPAGEAILKDMVNKHELSDEILVDSCGIGKWHVGQKAHATMRKAAEERGYTITSIARQLTPSDFQTFDYLLAAEKSVYDHLVEMAQSPNEATKVHMLTDFSERFRGEDVPDPYYGGQEHFDETLDILEVTVSDLFDYILKNR